MKKYIRLFLIFLSVSILSSCVTLSPNIKQTDKLEEWEAILVTRIHASPSANGQLSVHQGFASLPYAILSIDAGVHLKVVKIEASDGLRFSTYRTEGQRSSFDSDTLNFSIKPQSITYIGDVHIDLKRSNVSIFVTDDEEETMALVKKAYPELLSKLKFEKHLISAKQ